MKKSKKCLSKKVMSLLIAIGILVTGVFLTTGCTSQENEVELPKETGTDSSAGDSYDLTQGGTENESEIEITNISATDENIMEFVTLGEYLGIEFIPVASLPVTESDIDAWIDNFLSQAADFVEITDREVELGDIVIIDFEGFRDGVAFEGGTAQGVDLEIGSRRFIPGFEEQIIGHRSGDQFDINVIFPDDYDPPELAGVPVVFSINLIAIYTQMVPELTDEVVQEYLGVDSVEEYRALVRQHMEEERAMSAESFALEQVWQTVLDNATVHKIPEDEIELKISGFSTEILQAAMSQGMSVDELVEHFFPGMLFEDFIEEELRPSAITDVQQDLVMRAIAVQEGITLSDDEFNESVRRIIETFAYESEEHFFSIYGEHNVRISLLSEKVFEFILEHAITE